MSKERDEAARLMARAMTTGDGSPIERCEPVIDAILAAVRAEKSEANAPDLDAGLFAEARAARRAKTKAPCGTCGDAKMVCDSQAPPGGIDRHGRIGCSHRECANNRRPCPDCSAAPESSELSNPKVLGEMVRVRDEELAKLRTRVKELEDERPETFRWWVDAGQILGAHDESISKAARRVMAELAQAKERAEKAEARADTASVDMARALKLAKAAGLPLALLRMKTIGTDVIESEADRLERELGKEGGGT